MASELACIAMVKQPPPRSGSRVHPSPLQASS